MFLGADVSAEVSLHLEVGLRHDGHLAGALGVERHVTVGGPAGSWLLVSLTGQWSQVYLVVEPPANRGSGRRDHLGPRDWMSGAGVEVEAVVEVEVEVVSLLALLSVLEKCSLLSVLLTSGPSTARPVVTELGLNLPPGRAEEISLQVVRVRVIVR